MPLVDHHFDRIALYIVGPLIKSVGDICTVDPRLTDGSTYILFKLQTSLAAKFRFDLQLENRPTDQEKNQNGTKTEQKQPVTD